MKDSFVIVFNFKKELDKCILVQKKTKKINKMFFIPKSIIISRNEYKTKKSLWKDLSYELNRIELELPKWFCDKELGFYK